MITCELDADGNGKVVETFNRPIVYLDNWALNEIALCTEWREKFIQGMNDKNGHLRVSLMNLTELITQTDKDQIDSILTLIDSTDSGIINIDMFDVMSKEKGQSRFTCFGNPSSDLETSLCYLQANGFPNTVHVRDIFNIFLKGNPPLSTSFSDWTQFSDMMESTTEKGRKNEAYLNKIKEHAREIRKKPTEERALTKELFYLAYKFVMSNKDMTMNSNEWKDIFHTVVPVAYCDYVLLDRRWVGFVNETGFGSPHIAKVYSKKDMSEFFEVLCEFEPA